MFDSLNEIKESCEMIAVNVDLSFNELSTMFDKYIFDVLQDNTYDELDEVKKQIKEYLEFKTKNQRMGLIAEFFAHLYLININFKKYNSLMNLEEDSAKKGFDGYYYKLDDEWIMESKSGDDSSQNISHKAKLVDAYEDLIDKFEGKKNKKGKTPNNPWRNALKHAQICDADDSILKRLKSMSKKYLNEEYSKIDDYNVIPVATVFDSDCCDNAIKKVMIKNAYEEFKDKRYKKILLLMFSNKVYKHFLQYFDVK